MLRTKKQILRDYLVLLNKEKNLNYSDKDIDSKINNPAEKKITERLLLDELYSAEVIKGQTVSTERAFFILCDIVVRYDFKTGDMIWNNFVKMQFLLVERNKLSCYMAARGHGKTFFLGLYSLFKMFLIPYYEIGYCSNIPRQRRRFLKLFRSLIDTNELLLEKKDKQKILNKDIPWGTEEADYNEGLLEGTTVGTTPRGGHYNLAIGDDPLRDDKKYTYEFIVNYFQGIYKQTIYRKKGRYIIVGTPQDPEDLFHTLMNSNLDKNNRPIGKLIAGKISSAGFYSEIFPGILNDKKKELLVPEIWTYDELMIEKGRIGEIRFNREILCKCITYRNSLIGSALFRSCCDEKLTMLQKGESGKKYVCFIDSATSDAPTADYCSMAVFEDDIKNNKFIFRYLFHEKGYPITDPTGGTEDQINEGVRIYNSFNKCLMVVEKNNAGIALSQALQAKGVEVIEHYTHVIATGKPTEKPGKANDVIDYIEKGLKSGVVWFPSNPEDNYTIDSLEKIKGEHLNFGVKKGKSGEKFEAIAGHDDIFDSCWGAFKYSGDNVDTIPFAITLPGS